MGNKGSFNSLPHAPGSSRGGCKRCEFCYHKQFGCLDSDCYCHTHHMEPGEG